jgi:hypothetical protein
METRLLLGAEATDDRQVEALAESAIRNSFVNCSKGEAKRLTLPGRLVDIAWQDLDFLGWRDPKAQNNAYVVLQRDDALVGLALQSATQPKGRVKRSMCAFCCTVHGAADVSLFSARRVGAAGRLGNTVGTYACADLACCLYVRGKRVPTGPKGASEGLSVDERIERTITNLNKFVDEVLIDNA